MMLFTFILVVGMALVISYLLFRIQKLSLALIVTVEFIQAMRKEFPVECGSVERKFQERWEKYK